MPQVVCARPSPLACAVFGDAFRVNGALVSVTAYCMEPFALPPHVKLFLAPINQRRASTVFQAFGLTRQLIELRHLVKHT